MFDFFKDVYYEANGLDTKAIEFEKENRKKIKNQKINDEIFSYKTRNIFVGLVILYLIMSLCNIGVMIAIKINYLMIIKLVIQIILAITILCFLIKKNKKCDQNAIILMIGLILFIYSSIFFV